MRARCIALTAALLSMPSVSAAQTRDFSAVRDSLARITNSLELRRHTRVPVRQTSDANAYVERGLALLRLYELTDEREVAKDAKESFEKATELAPNVAWAHYGLGLSLARGPELRVRVPGGVLDNVTVVQTFAEIFGRDPRSEAMRSMERAIELDPAMAPAALEIAVLALESREDDELETARRALGTVADRGGRLQDVALALADVETALGNLEAADSAARAAMVNASDVSVVQHARAIALLRQPGREEEGARAYFEGLASMTEASSERYWKDAELVANDREEFQWTAADLEARRRWLREFWELRAATAGITPERRLAEHYRRLAIAQTQYRRTQTRGAPPSQSLVLENVDERLMFDDRGMVYVRYGDPANRIATTSNGLRPNETWVYNLPDGSTQFFHFAALRNGHDFALVEDLFSLIEDGRDTAGLISIFEDRATLDPHFALYADRLRVAHMRRPSAFTGGGGTETGGPVGLTIADVLPDLRRQYATETGRYRMAVLDAIERDHAAPAFDREMPFYYDLLTFRGSGNTTDLTATLAIPGNMVEPQIIDGRTVYALNISLVVIDTLARTVTRTDTIYRFRAPRRLGAGEHMRMEVDVAAPPTRTAIHRLLVRSAVHAGEGQIYGGSVEIPAYDREGLQLSEIVLAAGEEAEGWRRGNVELALLPPRQFASDAPLSVFYEIYNLEPAAEYSTEILIEATEGGGLGSAVKRLFGAGQSDIRLRFDGVAADARFRDGVQELRRVTPNLKPGRYRIRISVTDRTSGQSVTREKMFLVRDDG